MNKRKCNANGCDNTATWNFVCDSGQGFIWCDEHAHPEEFDGLKTHNPDGWEDIE